MIFSIAADTSVPEKRRSSHYIGNYIRQLQELIENYGLNEKAHLTAADFAALAARLLVMVTSVDLCFIKRGEIERLITTFLHNVHGNTVKIG